MTSLGDAMIPRDKLLMVPIGTTLKEAATLMYEKKVSSLVVMDAPLKNTERMDKAKQPIARLYSYTPEGRPLGLVTKTDLCAAIAQDLDLKKTPVGNCVWKNVPRLELENTKTDAAAAFVKNKAHHCFIFDKMGNFSGLLSSLDLAREITLDAKAWPYSRDGPMFRVASSIFEK